MINLIYLIIINLLKNNQRNNNQYNKKANITNMLRRVIKVRKTNLINLIVGNPLKWAKIKLDEVIEIKILVIKIVNLKMKEITKNLNPRKNLIKRNWKNWHYKKSKTTDPKDKINCNSYKDKFNKKKIENKKRKKPKHKNKMKSIIKNFMK